MEDATTLPTAASGKVKRSACWEPSTTKRIRTVDGAYAVSAFVSHSTWHSGMPPFVSHITWPGSMTHKQLADESGATAQAMTERTHGSDK
jgi:hypothetical protein